MQGFGRGFQDFEDFFFSVLCVSLRSLRFKSLRFKSHYRSVFHFYGGNYDFAA
jgi:hypothetical protein